MISGKKCRHLNVLEVGMIAEQALSVSHLTIASSFCNTTPFLGLPQFW
jgi:hypothetical protein